ncbi:MAG: ester cyclase [Chloroflexia bacterium]|nr:ester cyclase [Chloroflexia bacterium]
MTGRSRFVVTALAACSLFGSLALPASAAQDATPAAECAVTTPEENAELARAYWVEGVWGPQGKIAEIVAPNEVHHWGIAGTTHGFDEFAERWALFNTAFPDLKFNVDQVTATDDMAATVWTATGTQEGEWQGIAPTGKTVSWTGINVFSIACGQIAESWGEADHVGLRAALGATDVPALPMAEAMTAGTPVAGDAAASCASPGAEANLATAERWSTEVWNNQDLGVLDEIASPEILHHGAAFPDVSGVDDLKGALTRQFEAFPDIVITVDDAFADDNAAVVRWSGTATLGGDFLGESASGAPLTFSGVNVYRMECGQIVESWSEMNTLDVLHQIRDAAAGDATPVA